MINKKDWCCINGNRIMFKEIAYYDDYDYVICNYKLKGKNPVIIEGDAAELESNYWKFPKTKYRKVKIKIYNPIMEIQ